MTDNLDQYVHVNVEEVDIEEQMKNAYLDYAMSVIIARALPDVRDGQSQFIEE